MLSKNKICCSKLKFPSLDETMNDFHRWFTSCTKLSSTSSCSQFSETFQNSTTSQTRSNFATSKLQPTVSSNSTFYLELATFISALSSTWSNF